MARNDLKETLELPAGVSVTITDGRITFKGPEGELSRNSKVPGVVISTQGNELVLESKEATRTHKNLLFTTKAHCKNMIKGVQEGFTYKLKICSGHFPMTVTAKGEDFEIKNFIGEKVPRRLKIKAGAAVKVSGDDIEVNATSKELAGQVAADIEKLTRRPGFDKRIFQDGIYITHKDGKEL